VPISLSFSLYARRPFLEPFRPATRNPRRRATFSTEDVSVKYFLPANPLSRNELETEETQISTLRDRERKKDRKGRKEWGGRDRKSASDCELDPHVGRQP